MNWNTWEVIITFAFLLVTICALWAYVCTTKSTFIFYFFPIKHDISYAYIHRHLEFKIIRTVWKPYKGNQEDNMQINSNTETNGHEIQDHDSVSSKAMDNIKPTSLIVWFRKAVAYSAELKW